jgi:hypothetical protein
MPGFVLPEVAAAGLSSHIIKREGKCSEDRRYGSRLNAVDPCYEAIDENFGHHPALWASRACKLDEAIPCPVGRVVRKSEED